MLIMLGALEDFSFIDRSLFFSYRNKRKVMMIILVIRFVNNFISHNKTFKTQKILNTVYITDIIQEATNYLQFTVTSPCPKT